MKYIKGKNIILIERIGEIDHIIASIPDNKNNRELMQKMFINMIIEEKLMDTTDRKIIANKINSEENILSNNGSIYMVIHEGTIEQTTEDRLVYL